MKELKNKNIMTIIPARGGSKGIPKKNIVKLAGLPLMAYSINSAKKSKLINRLIVSTDSAEIAAIAKNYGAEIPFLRPKRLARDDTPAYPVLRHCLESLDKKENYRPEIIVWLEPTFPLRTAEEIDQAIEKLQSDKNADSLRSVCRPFQNPFKMWRLKGKYLQPLIGSRGKSYHTGPRQKTPEAYWQNGHLYLIKYKTAMEKNSFFGDKILPFILPDDRFIDIDEPADLDLAEYFIKKFKARHNL